MRIDSHQHFWRPSRGDYVWLDAGVPALAPLVRDFLPVDLEPTLRAHSVRQTVLVQAAESTAETEFLMDLADRCEFVCGVVGWVDLSREQAVDTLEAWARHPKFKGVRPMLQDLPQVDWIERAPHPHAVRALIRLGLRFDALVMPQHLPSLLRFARAWPELPMVVDHAAKPRLAQGWQGPSGAWAEGWRDGMAALAALPQVHCKFSGLLTELAPGQRVSPAARVDALRPVWDALLRWFGPRRLMWGSDWPVVTLAGDYASWVAVAGALIGELPPADQAQLWSDTARRFYGLA